MCSGEAAGTGDVLVEAYSGVWGALIDTSDAAAAGSGGNEAEAPSCVAHKGSPAPVLARSAAE